MKKSAVKSAVSPQANGLAATARNEIVVYQPDETIRLDVRLENETVWLTQAQLCALFGVVKSNVSYHLKNIFGTRELDYGATVQKIRTVRLESGRSVARDIEYFNLDVIISLGYRINSKLGIQFRQWATRVLKEFLLRGYSVNSRLNQLEDKMDRRLAKHDDDIAELKSKVDFFVQTQTPPLQGVFYNGQLWDARVFVERLIRARFAASRSRHLHRSRKAYDPFSGRVALPRDRMESRRLGGATGITGVSPVAVERQQIGNTSRTAGERNRLWHAIRNSTASLRSKI